MHPCWRVVLPAQPLLTAAAAAATTTTATATAAAASTATAAAASTATAAAAAASAATTTATAAAAAAASAAAWQSSGLPAHRREQRRQLGRLPGRGGQHLHSRAELIEAEVGPVGVGQASSG